MENFAEAQLYPSVRNAARGIWFLGGLAIRSSFGSQGAPIHYKAWVCTNPDCGFNIKIRNGDVYLNEPITSGAMHAPRAR